MASIYQLGAGALVGVVCLMTIRRQNGEIALLLGLAVCAGLLLAAARGMSAVLELIRQLAETAEIDPLLLRPLLRTAGIAIVTGLSAQTCRDAGAGSVAMTVELCGGLCALYVSVPLIQAVFAMIRELL